MAEDLGAASQPEGEGEPSGNEPIKYDESMLIMEKGKVKQPKQPDHGESRLLISKLQLEITKRSERIKEIKALEETLRGKVQGVASGNPEVIKKLQALRRDRGVIISAKSAVREELRGCDATRESLRAEMRSIRDKSRMVDAEKIEIEIAQLEHKLQHESLAEREEKRATTQLASLTAARPTARKYAEFDVRLKETEARRVTIAKHLQSSDADLQPLDDAIAAYNLVLDEARAKSDSHREDIPILQVEKKESYEICVVLRSKIDELRKQNDEEYSLFSKQDRAFRGYQREERRKKYEDRHKERTERDHERAEATGGAEGAFSSEGGSDGPTLYEPFQAEVLTCDQMLHYIRGLATSCGVKDAGASGADTSAAAAAAPVIEVPAGLKPFKRDETMGDIFAGLGKKAKPAKAGSKAAPPPKAAAPAEPPKPKVIKLNFTLETLKTLFGLGVEVPQTSADLSATIAKVEAKRQAFLERRKRVKEGKDIPEHSKGPKAAVEAPPPVGAAPEEEPAAAAAAAEEEPAATAAATVVEPAAVAEAAVVEPAAAAAAAAAAAEEEPAAAAAAAAAEEEPAAAPAETVEEPAAADAKKAAESKPQEEGAAAPVAAAEAAAAENGHSKAAEISSGKGAKAEAEAIQAPAAGKKGKKGKKGGAAEMAAEPAPEPAAAELESKALAAKEPAAPPPAPAAEPSPAKPSKKAALASVAAARADADGTVSPEPGAVESVKPAGDGVGVELTVSGEKVSLSISPARALIL